ncbi:hypothetical protein GJ744_002821 [Endocarpon pusillum]|uniref:Uncharacterized protein n=1 Tax=Endocarpon pusillum TaxID=364733 RepID=A0A8H7AMY1_9EURO|nr:hypothetical protein GJ744_002821 [Endocarpon pusillum]
MTDVQRCDHAFDFLQLKYLANLPCVEMAASSRNWDGSQENTKKGAESVFGTASDFETVPAAHVESLWASVLSPMVN